MTETSLSLLDTVRFHRDEAAWQRLYQIYSPLIVGWLTRQGLSGPDADDVVQEVMSVVLRRVGEFERQRTGSFRSWLRNITVNCLRDYNKRRRRAPARGGSDFHQIVQQLDDPDSALSQMWNEEHDRHVLDKLLESIRKEFAAQTWQMFHAVAIEGRSAVEVAAELDTTRNAVFIAKSRVLSRLRELGAGLLDD